MTIGYGSTIAVLRKILPKRIDDEPQSCHHRRSGRCSFEQVERAVKVTDTHCGFYSPFKTRRASQQGAEKRAVTV